MRAHIFAVVSSLLLATGPAAAESADALLKKGKRLLAQKKYADACEAFVEVDKLEPGVGVKLSAARCFADWGKLATAYDWYADAERLATRTDDPRLGQIKELAAKLDVEVPRITINVPEGADREILATITLDGAPVLAGQLGAEQRVDPGPHLIEHVVGGETRRKVVPLERGGSSEVMLDIPEAGHEDRGAGTSTTTAEDEDGEAAAPPPRSPGRTHRIAGLSLAAGGVVAVGVAGALTLSARGRYHDALDSHCMGSTSMCDPVGLERTSDARSTANLATVITIAGGAMVAGGAVLYLIAPRAATDERRALYLAPSLGGDGGGVVFGGRY